jgi:hypothetical protein
MSLLSYLQYGIITNTTLRNLFWDRNLWNPSIPSLQPHMHVLPPPPLLWNYLHFSPLVFSVFLSIYNWSLWRMWVPLCWECVSPYNSWSTADISQFPSEHAFKFLLYFLSKISVTFMNGYQKENFELLFKYQFLVYETLKYFIRNT